MYDINFFSAVKKKKSKNSGFKIFLVIFLSLFILGNALLVGVYFFVTNGIQTRIDDLDALINSDETKEKIEEAARIKQEATLTREYLELLQSSTHKLEIVDTFDTDLLNKVRSLTPPNTAFAFAEYTGTLVNLECHSNLVTDPMDMYHAFLNDPAFATVSLSGINIDAQENVLFSIICQLAGGEAE